MFTRLFIILLLLGITAPIAISQTISKEIIESFEKGDAKKLSAYLHSNLELKIEDQLQIVSKNQGTRLIQDFFSKNPPSAFKVTYEGTKQGSKYGIAELRCKDAVFRVNLYFIVHDKQNLIYNLTIEKV